jgi:hypothetical protein
MGIVSKDGLEAVIQEIKKTALVSQSSGQESQAKAAGEYLHVVDAFDVPKWIYKHSDKSFIRCVIHFVALIFN